MSNGIGTSALVERPTVGVGVSMCPDCTGSGVMVDSDGSLTGTAGREVTCWCAESAEMARANMMLGLYEEYCAKHGLVRVGQVHERRSGLVR